MATITQAEALREIATRYDLDKDGKLSYPELVAYLIGVLGSNWSLPNRPQNNNQVVTNACIPESIYELNERGHKSKRGSALIDAIAKWTEATAVTSEGDRTQLARGLADHGYIVTADGYTRTDPRIAEGSFDALIRARLAGAPSNRTKDQTIGLTMDVTNALVSLKIAPSPAVQELLGETQRWTILQSTWTEDQAAAKIVLFDSAAKKFSALATSFVKEFFAQLDADNDGGLNRVELTALFLHVVGRVYPASSFDPFLKNGIINFDHLEAFYAKEPGSLFDLQRYFHRLGVDEHLKPPAKGWPVLTQDSWYLTELQSSDDQKRSVAMAALKHGLSQHPPLLPSKAVRDALSAIPSAAALTLACRYVDAVGNGPAVPPISSAADAVHVMHAAFTYLAWGMVPQQVNREVEPESKAVALADQKLEAFVKAHPGALEAELEKLLPTSGPIPEPVPSLLRTGGTATPTPDAFPECLWRTLRAVKPTWLATFVLNAHKVNKSGAANYPHKLLTAACELGGVETMNAVASRVPPYMKDWLRASATNTPLVDALDSDATICDMSDPELQILLGSYLDLDLLELGKHFATHNITRSAVDQVATTIIADCRQITKVLKVPGGRHGLAAKLASLVELGHYYQTARIMAMSDAKGAPANPKAATARATVAAAQAKRAERIKKELHLDPSNEVALKTFPVKILRLSTMGHHPDAFHPAVGMQSYYLNGDVVGGSAECMLVNTAMLKADEVEKFTLAEMEKKLSARLNAPKPADWEAHPAVLYFSDMAPYLIRTACCFESPGLRYRVDPSKLWNIIKPLFDIKPQA